MQLPGRLRSTTLGDVLGALYREQVSGVLELWEREDSIHRIHLSKGLVADVELAGVKNITERRSLWDDVFVGRLEGLTARLPDRRSRIESLFKIKDAELRFRVARPGQSHSPTLLEPVEFLLGKPRARDRSLETSVAQNAPANPRISYRREPQLATRRDPTRVRALQTLGLPEDASPGQVNHAFRQLARELHPDRHPQLSFRERRSLIERFAELSAAYHTLVA